MERIPQVPIPIVSDAEIAFGNASYLPKYSLLPSGFQNRSHPCADIVELWFYKGLSKDAKFYPRPGVNAEHAFRALKALLASWAPKHEHKIAGAAYLLYCWFEKVENY